MSGPQPLTKLHQLPPDDTTTQRMISSEIYVIDKDLVEVMARDDIQRSILALLGAGIAQLPHPRVVIEFELGSRWFVLLSEAPFGFQVEVSSIRNGVVLISSEPGRVVLKTDGVFVEHLPGEREMQAAAFATFLALLMLNIKGVDKELITTDRLNRARQQQGKPAVPKHAHVRIGRVYDRDGVAHERDGRRPMPVHIRSGHARSQFFGPGRSERKLIYIPPCIVNFEGEQPVPRQRKVSL